MVLGICLLLTPSGAAPRRSGLALGGSLTVARGIAVSSGSWGCRRSTRVGGTCHRLLRVCGCRHRRWRWPNGSTAAGVAALLRLLIPIRRCLGPLELQAGSCSQSMGDLLLAHVSGVGTINAHQEVVALNPVASHLCVWIDMQDMRGLLWRHKPKSASRDDDDLVVDFLNGRRLFEHHLHRRSVDGAAIAPRHAYRTHHADPRTPGRHRTRLRAPQLPAQAPAGSHI